MKRLGSALWEGEESTYAQVVFDAIKDNPSYSELLPSDLVSEHPWSLSWFGIYVNTIHESPPYSEVLAKMVDFMCEELQHERFQDIRPAVMVSAMQVG